MIHLYEGGFGLETAHTGYYLALRGGLLEMVHYGAKLHFSKEALQTKIDAGYGTDVAYQTNSRDSLLHLNLDLSPSHKGDFRQTALHMTSASGLQTWDWTYEDYQILDQAPDWDLPVARGGDQYLQITLTSDQGVKVQVLYGVFEASDVITRQYRILNHSSESLVINRALSYQLDLAPKDWRLHTFTGAWSRERHETIQDLSQGIHAFGSTTGTSSNFVNPFFFISSPQASQDQGEVYGFNLVYSGSHMAQVQVGPYRGVRVLAGIQDQAFAWPLEPGQSFDTPQAVLTYSKQGMNGMSHHMHDFINHHIIPSYWQKRPRPLVLNNWEATYFDFTHDKLVKLAKAAAGLGLETFVLDDGWFGHRDNDQSSLGDYSIHTKKLPKGLKGLAQEIRDLGMDFGIWVEPEMVSMDSDLYRAHPDWAVQSPGITPALGRNQLVLDLCQTPVQDYLIDQLSQLLHSAPISFVKWDMNRQLTDIYSPGLAHPGQFYHAWVLGLYRVMREVTGSFPQVLFEGCSSGGNRFDLGILSFMPQIWTSDDTDVYERMLIQTGTSYGYPPSTMSCHVSDSPNHQTLRTAPLESRFDVAAMGVLGYELDVTRLSAVQRKMVKDQITWYKANRDLLQFGQFSRLLSPFQSSERCRWQILDPALGRGVVLDAIGRTQPNQEDLPLWLCGLEGDSLYQLQVRREQIDLRQFGSLVNTALPVSLNAAGLVMHVIADHKTQLTEEESYQVYGDLVMEAGIRLKQAFTATGYSDQTRFRADYSARLYQVQKIEA